MRWSRGVLAFAIAAVISGCTPAPPAPARGGEVLARVASQDLTDAHFDALLERADLRKALGTRADEIIGQLREGRSAVARGAASAPRSGRRAPGLAAVSPAATDLFIVTYFAETFPRYEDSLTKSGGTQQLGSKPFSDSKTGATTGTTTTLNITETASGSGSRVTLTVNWIYRSATTDTASGATLVDISDERTMVGVIDVCPDASGNANASLDTHAVGSLTQGGVTTRRDATSSNTFVGTVDDNAVLKHVGQQQQVTTSWQTSTGSGGSHTTIGVGYGASDSGYRGGVDRGSLQFGSTTNGDTDIQAERDAAGSFALDAYAMEPAYVTAQKLWRNGRCVVVVAPDYGAETPIEVADQTKAQHDERVDQASQTKFGVGTKHRFGGTLSQSVTTSLAGETRLEPAKVEGAPGQLTYTAPNAQDLKATVLLRSTSKRGIGVLVLDFHTGRAAWTGVLTRKETVTAVHEGGGRSDKVTTTYDSQVKLGQTVSTTAGSDRLNGTISGSYALDGVHTSAWSQESCLKNFSGIDTTTESANGQGSADTTVTVATDLRTYHVTTGSASLANAVRGQSMRQSHQLVAVGNGCNVEARQTTSSFPITQALSLAGIEVTGDLDPKDPNHISGSRTETKEVTGTTTVVTITWDLTRK